MKTSKDTKTLVIPENILKLMAAPDRAALGKSGRLSTEIQAANEVRAEKEEHKLIRAWADLQQIPYLHDPWSWRKSGVLPPGWPDFTFIYGREQLLIEVKVGGNKLDEKQKEWIAKLLSHGTPVLVTGGFAETAEAVRRWAGPLGWTPV
jgi:hypothetical protein